MTSHYRLYARYGAGSMAVQVALEEAGAAYEVTWIARTPEEFRSIAMNQMAAI